VAVAVSGSRETVSVPPPVAATEAVALGVSDVFARLGSSADGLTEGEAARRLRVVGPNAVRSYRARAWPVLMGQLRSPLLLVQVAGVLTGAIFIINVALHKPVIDALLFSLSIAVGISPQLLPAVVSTSLAAGSRQLARSKVLVKRLVCIEDLGDVDVLFTDKTGTLTEGSLRFMRSAGPDGTAGDAPLLLGLLCNEAVVEDGHAAGGNPLDVALWDSPAAAGQQAALARWRRLDTLPFDHERRAVSVLADASQDTPVRLGDR
jgi:Mg2+-importing ATPase